MVRDVVGSQKGIGLIELMVSMMLGLLLVGAVIQVLVGQHATQRLNQSLNTIQTNARFVLYILERDLRRAGYWGCAAPDTKAPSAESMGAYGQVHVITADSTIGDWHVFAQALAPPQDKNIPDAANGQSAVLRLNYVRDPGVHVTVPANNRNARLQVSANPEGWDAGDQLLVTNCRVADLFTVTDTGNAWIAHATTNSDGETQNTQAQLSTLYGDDAAVFQPVGVIYYIRDTGVAGHSVPTLYRRQVAPTIEDSQALVMGISHLMLRYGVDRDGDSVPEAYVAANKVIDWRSIAAVRVGFVAVSVLSAGVDASSTLKMFGRTLQDLPDNDHLRRVYTTTVALRN